MKSIKISDYFNIIKPEYAYIKLTPNNSIKNNQTHKIARVIASLYRNITENIKKEKAKTIRLLGRDFMVGTKFSLQTNGKISYYVYVEKKRVEFYFIVPRHHLSVIQERISDAWSNITVADVDADTIPTFAESATKYQLAYTKEDALSLATDRRNSDLLNSNLNIIDVLDGGDRVGIFYNFVPTSQFTWRSKYENTINKVKRGLPVDRDKTGAGYLLKTTIGVVMSFANTVSEALAGTSEKSNANFFEQALEQMSGNKRISKATYRKANSTVLDTQIIAMSESGDKLKQRNNAKSLTQSFDAVSEDNRLVARHYRKPFEFTDCRIKGAETNRVGDEEAQNFLSIAGRDILEKYGFIDHTETKETQVPEDLRKGSMRIGTNTFRGHKQEAYLSRDREYKQLTLVLIGPTRAGKSTLIENLAQDAIQNDECAIIFDYVGNCELSDEVSTMFPREKVLNIECNDFERLQGLGYNEVGVSSETFKQYDNAKKQTTQLMTLINSINAEDKRLAPKMERYLQSAANVAFISGGSIRDVFRVLQDYATRRAFIENVPGAQRENLQEYIDGLCELNDYNSNGEIQGSGTKYSLIVGIIDRLNKLKANTYMELMLKKGTQQNIDLVSELQKNQLICVKMPEDMFSTDNERDIYTTYWMTKLWLALQMRKKKFGNDRKELRKVNLVIDELYQVENTEQFLTEKLSRLAKFGLKPIISCHYLNQIKHIREELRSANASYMLISGCDKKNFSELRDELYPFEQEDLLRLKRYHSMNLIKNKDGYGRFITKLPSPIRRH
jgi:energy-coupling factor transporter ATP-binding protein EcfA2